MVVTPEALQERGEKEARELANLRTKCVHQSIDWALSKGQYRILAEFKRFQEGVISRDERGRREWLEVIRPTVVDLQPIIRSYQEAGWNVEVKVEEPVESFWFWKRKPRQIYLIFRY